MFAPFGKSEKDRILESLRCLVSASSFVSNFLLGVLEGFGTVASRGGALIQLFSPVR
jgi:hypothetical protein